MRLNRVAAAALSVACAIVLMTPASEAGKAVHRVGAPVTVGSQGNEPNIVAAPDGTLYISALQYLYVSKDGGRTWTQTPPSIYNKDYNKGGLQVASDSSISVDPAGRLYFAFDYPYAGTTAVCTSDDAGATLQCDPVAIPGGTDRMWVAAPTTKQQFLVTNEGLYQTLLFTSGDRGQTWTYHQTTSKGMNSNTGDLFMSPKDHQIYQAFTDNASNQTATNNFASGPLGFHIFDGSTGAISGERTTPLLAGAALPSAGFTTDGTLYIVSDVATPKAANTGGGKPGVEVVVARSTNGGKTWKKLPPIPGTTSGTSTFTAIATGAPGHVGVIWYQSATPALAASMPSTASWDVKWAETSNAYAAHPRWHVQTIERNVHKGPMCSTAGCSGSDRFAGDFVSATFDAHGLPHLTYESAATGAPVVRYAGPAH
ncbi:MAG: glycoside hydrolase [Actinomycetota bacterium]|nr:glycoside hydrolase [Actinomycetota bacterium]